MVVSTLMVLSVAATSIQALDLSKTGIYHSGVITWLQSKVGQANIGSDKRTSLQRY